MPFSFQGPITGAGPIAGSMVSPVGISVVDFAIPAGVRRITLVSSGLLASDAIVRLGTISGVLTTGYICISYYLGPSTGVESNSTVGIIVPKCSDAAIASYCMTFYRVSPNVWNATGQSRNNAQYSNLCIGNISLPGELTTFRYINQTIMTSGSLQLLWEL